MSMEHNGSNQNLSSPPLCRTGCGFYGNPSFEGMCSKCFKDSVKRGQQNPSAPLPEHLTDAITSSPSSTDAGLGATSSSSPCPPVDTSTTPSVETASTTVRATPSPPTTSLQLDKETTPPTSPVNEAGCSSDDKDKKPKKNRCHTCKKKVGLTGFECRCGGLYCGLHRYSDKHDCSFDYKELGQQQIRKANPVVVGEKVQKI